MSKFFIIDHVESEKWPYLAKPEKGRSKYLICWKVSKNLPEYIFPLPKNAFTKEGTGVKTDFIFREKVSPYGVVGKKNGCLTEQSSCLLKQSERRQCRKFRQSF